MAVAAFLVSSTSFCAKTQTCIDESQDLQEPTSVSHPYLYKFIERECEKREKTMLQLHSLRPWISTTSSESNFSSYKRSPFCSESIENCKRFNLYLVCELKQLHATGHGCEWEYTHDVCENFPTNVSISFDFFSCRRFCSTIKAMFSCLKFADWVIWGGYLWKTEFALN